MVNHPIAYALVAVFAVGIAVFQFISHRQREQEHSRSGKGPRGPGGPPPGPRGPPPPSDKPGMPNDKPGSKPNNKPGSKLNDKPVSKPSDKPGSKPSDKPGSKPNDKPGKPTGKPDDKPGKPTGKPNDKPGKPLENSSKSESSPSSNNENSVRYRKPHSERLNKSKQEESNTVAGKSNAKNPRLPRDEDRNASDSNETLQTSSGFIKNELQNSSFNEVGHQKMDEKNYEKNVFDRLVNETKRINKDPKEEVKLSNKNILEDSDSDNDSFQESLDLMPTGAGASHQAVCPSEDSQNKKNEEKEDQMKEAYKQEITDRLRKDIENGDEETGAAGNALDDVNIEEVRSRISSNMEQNKCSGCEEMPCNAVALPCEHCYLCKDCARVVLKCSPKCSVCLADIEDFR